MIFVMISLIAQGWGYWENLTINTDNIYFLACTRNTKLNEFELLSLFKERLQLSKKDLALVTLDTNFN